MKRKHSKFVQEFKAESIKLVIEQGYTQTEVAERLGISSKNISRWMSEMASAKNRIKPKLTIEQEELYHLRNPVEILCKVMEVSRSGCYRFLQRKLSDKQIWENKILLAIKVIAQESRNSYGSRRMAKQLQSKGYAVCRYAVCLLMCKAGIECKQRRVANLSKN